MREKVESSIDAKSSLSVQAAFLDLVGDKKQKSCTDVQDGVERF